MSEKLTNEQKVEYVKGNKQALVAAFNSYLDFIYDLHDQYFDENNNLKEGLKHDEKLEGYIKSSYNESKMFEDVRRKLNEGDFNLSNVDFSYMGLALLQSKMRMDNQIKELSKSSEIMSQMIEKLMN